MDWYKLFEIVAPSITTGGVIVIGAYLGYFKKKFATYGDIDAKLEKLEKLEVIEKALTKSNKNIEYEYKKRQDDSIKLIEFYETIEQLNSETQKLHIDTIEYYNNVFAQCRNGEYSSAYQVSHKTVANNIIELTSQIDKHNTTFLFYFSEYGNENFNKSYLGWQKNIVLTHLAVGELKNNIQKFMCLDDDEKVNLEDIHKVIVKFENDIDINEVRDDFADIGFNIYKLNQEIQPTPKKYFA
ncbi:Putative uncharacterized protein [Moritella viscosa]|uniref:hypothetical protein n=1 Tax=Moritella viscosa TaxID=80854 RepID=UPI00092087FE|nr:hypothetical protein [Moritella viscosa]SGY93121.1 Putative uncharacterized protein [Moritella viscosa]